MSKDMAVMGFVPVGSVLALPKQRLGPKIGPAPPEERSPTSHTTICHVQTQYRIPEGPATKTALPRVPTGDARHMIAKMTHRLKAVTTQTSSPQIQAPLSRTPPPTWTLCTQLGAA